MNSTEPGIVLDAGLGDCVAWQRKRRIRESQHLDVIPYESIWPQADLVTELRPMSRSHVGV
jgi:hypothetical protein